MATLKEKTAGVSRLTQMQARFQQRQLQERELKIASLYEAQQARALDRVRQSPTDQASKPSTRETPVSVHPGKVRQMFEERRTKAGIDKSYPLQPIHNTADRRKPVASTNDFLRSTRVVEKKTQVTNTRFVVNTKKTQLRKTENLVNGCGDLNQNHELDLNAVKRNLPKSHGEHIPGIDELDRAENNYLLENETPPPALATSPPRSPEPKRPPRRSHVTKNSQQEKSSPTPVAPPRKTTSENSVPRNYKPKEVMQCPANASSRRSPTVLSGPRGTRAPRKTASAAPPAVPATATGPAFATNSAAATANTGQPCSVCGRRFAPDRLQKHEEICRRAANKKRKPFDALKHRLAGTEAEPFINKLRKTASTKVKPLNSTWRQKHEEFINAIRAAKEVKAHISTGGKLSDLPPPPPSENPDYVQCPHCKRRFNQAAAERHIPKCASYQFNKPKGQTSKTRR